MGRPRKNAAQNAVKKTAETVAAAENTAEKDFPVETMTDEPSAETLFDSMLQNAAEEKAEEKAEDVREKAVTEQKASVAPINMVVEQKAPPVKILYIDSVIPNNQIPIGNGRYITGSGRIFAVPLEQFEGEFMSPLVMKLLDNRKFVVLDGLTDEQRMQYNCYYSKGEVIKNEGVFDSLLNMSADKAAEIYAELCPQHKELVATRFMTAYFERRDNRVTREKVEALNKISKAVDEEGLFTPILKEINEKSL